jgi:hypothetical protein
VKEASPVVLAHLYRALSVPGQAPAVLTAFLRVFDQRLGFRRGSAVVCDGAEQSAWEYFRGNLAGLDNDQKAELVRRVAVFLRLDAERYNAERLSEEEIIKLELSLVEAEAVLVANVQGQSARIDATLQRGGQAVQAEVLAKVHEWVGDTGTQQAGVLNAAPWNVPTGAP